MIEENVIHQLRECDCSSLKSTNEAYPNAVVLRAALVICGLRGHGVDSGVLNCVEFLDDKILMHKNVCRLIETFEDSFRPMIMNAGPD